MTRHQLRKSYNHPELGDNVTYLKMHVHIYSQDYGIMSVHKVQPGVLVHHEMTLHPNLSTTSIILIVSSFINLIFFHVIYIGFNLTTWHATTHAPIFSLFHILYARHLFKSQFHMDRSAAKLPLSEYLGEIFYISFYIGWHATLCDKTSETLLAYMYSNIFKMTHLGMPQIQVVFVWTELLYTDQLAHECNCIHFCANSEVCAPLQRQ